MASVINQLHGQRIVQFLYDFHVSLLNIGVLCTTDDIHVYFCSDCNAHSSYIRSYLGLTVGF